MDSDLLKEIQACIGGLSETQRESLREVFGEEESDKPDKTRRGLEKNGIHTCSIIVKCVLCGTHNTYTMQSVSPKSSSLDVPTCGACYSVLVTRTVEDLAILAIRAADGAYALVKDAKNAPVECGWEPYIKPGGDD